MKKTVLFLILAISGHLVFAQKTIVIGKDTVLHKNLNVRYGYKIDLSLPGDPVKPYLSFLEYAIETKYHTIQYYNSGTLRSFAKYEIDYSQVENENQLPIKTFEFYNAEGNKLWQKLNFKFDYALLSSDGKYCTIIITYVDEESSTSSKSLIIYDTIGDEIFKEDSICNVNFTSSNDLICYQKDSINTGNPDNVKEFYCYDLMNMKLWSKSFVNEVSPRPTSLNGNYIIAYYDGRYNLYNRDGKELFNKPVTFFGGGLSEISNDGEYAICERSSSKDTTFFEIYSIKNMTRIVRTKYADVEPTTFKIYNGSAFVNHSKYIIALTSIIAPYTAMIVFHNIKGEYLGHKVYYDIPSSFSGPNITLLDDGSFEVYVDGYYLGNLVLPDVNTLKYLKK